MHQIGVGVLGPVYRAQDTVRDQLVAVKVFKVDAPPEQAEQIAEALQAVVQALPRHRGLVEFIAAGVERDTAFLVMAHSDVPSLDSRLKPGAADSSTPPVDAEQALVIVRTLAEAMDAAHARGIVHGGLHPRDIFVDDRGACRAAGFGVATALGRAGVRVPVRRPYSPPERLTSAPIEPPADRFALGAIAFELLTGRRIAGTGSNAAARYNASVPGADLDAVRNALAAMLAEQPAHRPSTANAFAQALSLALFPQGVARASAAAGATGANRTPFAAGRDDRRENGRENGRDPNTAAGAGLDAGAGTTAGAIGASALNLSRDSDGPSRDDLELFTREGLFTGQPKQSTLSWEPVESENVVPPGEDPLELFAPSPSPSSPLSSSPDTESPDTESSAAEPGAAVPSTEPAESADSADSAAAPPIATSIAAEARGDVKVGATEEASEVPVRRLDSILGLSTTIVGPLEGDAAPAKDASTASAQPPAASTQGDDEGHETTALPFVPIKADPRVSPHDDVLIDDNSRLDTFDRVDRHHGNHHEHSDHPDHLDHMDRMDRGARVDDGDRLDRLDDLQELDRFGQDDDRFDRDGAVDDADEADDSSSMTPAAAAAAGVIAAGGVTSGAPDLSAAHLAHHSHASHGSHASHEAEASETSRFAPARGDRAHAGHTQAPFDREAREAETWVAPAAVPSVTPPPSMLTNPPETSDVGSSVRVVGLVLALGLAVGGAGGYLLGQRGSLRNGSTFDQAADGGDAGSARPAAGGDQAGGASAGNAAAPDAAGAGAGAAPGGSGASGAAAAGKAGDSRNPDAAGSPASPSANAPAARPDSAGRAGSAAASAPAGASSSTGASRPAAATGRLTINSTPPRGDVAIDGVRRGVTPLTVRDLSFGSHTVRVTRGGYAPETRRVNVVAGRPAESITFDLEPTAPRTRPSTAGGAAAGAASPASPAPERGSASGLGALYIVSRPMGAKVTVDGRLVGATPLLLTDVSSGSHTIQLQADGHKPWQTTVQVKAGERTRVAGSLEEGR